MKKIIVFSVILLLISMAVFAADASDLTVDLITAGFDTLGADVAVGEAIQVGDTFVIPLFEANTFFLGGGGGQPVMGAGGIGSLNLVPYAVLIISGDDYIVKPLSNKVPFLEQLVGILPEVLPLVMQYFTVDGMSVESQEIKVQEVPLVEEKPIAEGKVPETVEVSPELEIESVAQELLHNDDLTTEQFKALKSGITRLMKKVPDNPKVHALNGYITLRLLADASPIEQMKYGMEAQNSINKALAMDPSDYFANLASGWLNLYSPMGQISVSVKGFENAIKSKPDQAEGYFGIVEAYVKTGNMEMAKEYAEKGKTIAPDSAEYFDELLNK